LIGSAILPPNGQRPLGGFKKGFLWVATQPTKTL